MKTLSLAIVAIAGFVSVANAALADGGAKFLGNITTGGQIRSDMGTYWNQITPENGCKWGSIHSLSNGNSGTSKFAWDNFDKCEQTTGLHATRVMPTTAPAAARLRVKGNKLFVEKNRLRYDLTGHRIK